MRTVLILLFGCLLAFIKSAAQQSDSCSFVLSGIVTDSSNHEVLSYAFVRLRETNSGKMYAAYADEKGRYNLHNICAGTYGVECSHLTCERVQITITINANKQLNIKLPHHTHEGSTIVITDKASSSPISQSRTEITGRTLEQVRGRSLGDAVKNVPGVTSLQTGSNVSKPMIHGLHSNRILILNNGIRQEGQQWGLEHAPEIDPFIANKITVIKGANSVRYGSDALAGVILVEPDDFPDSTGFTGELNMVGFSNNREGNISLMTQQNIKQLRGFAWRTQGSLKRGGNMQTPDYRLWNSGVREANFSLAAGLHRDRYEADVFYSQFNTDIGIFSGSHIGNITDLYTAFNSTRPLAPDSFSYSIDRPFQHVEHELAKARLHIHASDVWTVEAVYARQYNRRLEYDKHRPRNDSLAALNRPELSYEITSHSVDLLAEHHNIKRFTGGFGISGQVQSNTYEGRFFIPNFRNQTVGVWWVERWHGDSILTLEAGVRYDYRHLQAFLWENNEVISPVRIFSNASGSLGASIRFNDELILGLNAGAAWRAPTVNELYSNGLHHGAASVEIGNKNLSPETAWNSIATLNWHRHDKIDAEIGAYYNYITDFIFAMPVQPPTVTIQGAFPTFQFTQANVVLKGVDLSLRAQLMHHLTLIGKGAILRAWNRSLNDWLILMPADRFELGLQYELADTPKRRDTYVGASMQYVNRQFRVPLNSDFVPPPNGYFLLSMQAGYTFRFKSQELTIGLSGTNLLNAAYRDYLNRFRYYADEMGRNIRVHVRIPFNLAPHHNKS